jgi:biotin synthase
VNLILQGDKYLLKSDVNEDMKMFEMLGLKHKAFTKVSQPATVEAVDSQFVPYR